MVEHSCANFSCCCCCYLFVVCVLVYQIRRDAKKPIILFNLIIVTSSSFSNEMCFFLLFLFLFLFFYGYLEFGRVLIRYNNLNVDQILSSERLVTNYVECLLSRKPCPPEGKDLKRKFILFLGFHFKVYTIFAT